MKFSAYLFDFDGTLVDSMPTFASGALKVLDENHIPYGEDIIKVITPLGDRGIAKYYRELGLTMQEEEIINKMHSYALDAYKYRIQAKDNVIQTIKKLKDNGAALYVLTASPHSMLDVCLKRLEIYDIFQNVWSCDDFNKTKADPALYKMVAEKIKKPIDEILFLDDNFDAMKTAKTAGIKVCGVYDLSAKAYANEIKSVADYYIYDFSELLTF